MTKKPKKKNTQELKEAMNTLTKKEELEERIKQFKYASYNCYQFDFNPSLVIKKGVKIVDQYMKTEDTTLRAQLDEDIKPLIAEYHKASSLDTHYHLINTIEKPLRGFALETLNQLKKEYEISKPQDKALIQLAVNALCRYQSNMYEFENWKQHDFNSHERVAYMGMLSKDSDRAFRAYLSIIQHLEAKQNPNVQIQVKTQNAFIAQNQQNNATVSPNPIHNDQQ